MDGLPFLKLFVIMNHKYDAARRGAHISALLTLRMVNRISAILSPN